jgi:hypothetical protein
MSLFPGKYHNNALYISQSNQGPIYYADITRVDSIKQTMSVFVRSLHDTDDVPINQMLSLAGAGIRSLPVPGTVLALLYKDTSGRSDVGYHHIGYFLPQKNLEEGTANRDETKIGKVSLLRYLEPGEAQIISMGQAELFLSNDGSVKINSGSGNYINLNEYTQSAEIMATDLDIQVLDVSIKAGRIKRVPKEHQTETNNPSIMRDIENEGEEDENITTHTEFRVDIGTVYDSETGNPSVEANEDTGIHSAPATGTLAFASKVYDQEGEQEKLLQNLDTIVKFLLKLPSKMHMGVDEYGNFYIVNEQTDSYFKFRTNFSDSDTDTTQLDFVTSEMSFSCNREKFSIINKDNSDQMSFGKDENGNTEFSIRCGNTGSGSTAKNVMSFSDKEGPSLTHSSGSGISFTDDGDVIIKHKCGASAMFKSTGFDLNMAGGSIMLTSKNTVLVGTDGVTLGIPPTSDSSECLLLGEATADFLDQAFDNHIHKGPMGPPTIPLLMKLSTTGTGQLQVAKVQVSAN